jgi:hypothetical protein
VAVEVGMDDLVLDPAILVEGPPSAAAAERPPYPLGAVEHPPAARQAEPEDRVERPPVGLGEVVSAAGGLAALGAAIALGTGDLQETARLAPLLVGPTFGAVVLTTPALVVAHQFLRVDAPVGSLADVLARAVARVGQVGWGFAPLTLLFAVTAPGSWPVLFAGDGLVLGVVGVLNAVLGLIALDRRTLRWELAVVGWCVLTLLVAARLVSYALWT